eukprot:g36969.t1
MENRNITREEFQLFLGRYNDFLGRYSEDMVQLKQLLAQSVAGPGMPQSADSQLRQTPSDKGGTYINKSRKEEKVQEETDLSFAPHTTSALFPASSSSDFSTGGRQLSSNASKTPPLIGRRLSVGSALPLSLTSPAPTLRLDAATLYGIFAVASHASNTSSQTLQIPPDATLSSVLEQAGQVLKKDRSGEPRFGDCWQKLTLHNSITTNAGIGDVGSITLSNFLWLLENERSKDYGLIKKAPCLGEGIATFIFKSSVFWE